MEPHPLKQRRNSCALWEVVVGVEVRMSGMPWGHSFLFMRNKASLLPNSSMSRPAQSQNSKIHPLFHPDSVLFGPNGQSLCWYNPISVPGFCWFGWIITLLRVISSWNHCPATLLVFFSKTCSLIFCNMDRQNFSNSSGSLFFSNNSFQFISLLTFYSVRRRRAYREKPGYPLNNTLIRNLFS